MVCEHLSALEADVLASGARETFRGASWSENCREWLYVDCYLDIDALRTRYALPDFVEEHTHRGTHDGSEHGLVCSRCLDAVMGLPDPAPGAQVFGG